jgi:PIN domain nuclease of toxin-antitoxin system
MDSPDLSEEARRAIADRRNSVHVSVASLWEIAIKAGKGKLDLFHDFDRTLDQEPFARLAILTPHARAVRLLPNIHGDPFDRILVAQARVEGLTLVTRDKVMQQYELPLIAA